jgi:uncharacterized protein
MVKKRMITMAGVIFLGTTLLFTGGCGFKNKPVPPASVVPAPIDDLRYTVTDKGVQLVWSYPVRTIRGSVLEEVSDFELFRAEIPLADYCGGCPVPFTEPMSVAGGSSVDGETRRKATFDMTMLKPGHKYFVKVRSRNSWFADSDDSNIITFVWFDPAPATAKVSAKPGDREISLSWQPVALKGAAADMSVKYQVLRSSDGKEYTKQGELVGTPSFVDRNLVNGRKYFYTVQSITDYKNELALGGVSKEIEAIPQDMTAPLPPAGVSAVRTEAGIKVFWDRSDAADLAGYKVYRRSANKDAYEMIGTVEPIHTLFVDSKVDDSVRCYYAVTAFDTATPANESTKSREATIRN